jgi:hypothetical protein
MKRCWQFGAACTDNRLIVDGCAVAMANGNHRGYSWLHCRVSTGRQIGGVMGVGVFGSLVRPESLRSRRGAAWGMLHCGWCYAHRQLPRRDRARFREPECGRRRKDDFIPDDYRELDSPEAPPHDPTIESDYPF